MNEDLKCVLAYIKMLKNGAEFTYEYRVIKGKIYVYLPDDGIGCEVKGESSRWCKVSSLGHLIVKMRVRG